MLRETNDIIESGKGQSYAQSRRKEATSPVGERRKDLYNLGRDTVIFVPIS